MIIKSTKKPPYSPGQLIRAYRCRKGITLDKMAALLYCSKTELSLIENGKKPVSRMKRLLWSTLIPEWTPNMLSSTEQSSSSNE